jgi:hypothetical protein
MAEGLVPEVRDALGLAGELFVADRVGGQVDAVAVDVQGSREDGERDRPRAGAELGERRRGRGGDEERRRQVDPVAGLVAGERRDVVEGCERGDQGKECPLLPMRGSMWNSRTPGWGPAHDGSGHPGSAPRLPFQHRHRPRMPCSLVHALPRSTPIPHRASSARAHGERRSYPRRSWRPAPRPGGRT